MEFETKRWSVQPAICNWLSLHYTMIQKINRLFFLKCMECF